jgi:predicted MFS family arabinose efflux permease
MLQRYQNFSELCSILLAVICASTMITSLIESHQGRYPTWKVVFFEAPAYLYTLLLICFLLPSKLSNINVFLVLLVCVGVVLTFILRVNRYEIKRLARQRAEVLVSHQVVAQRIEEARVQVMTLIEKEKLRSRHSPKRVSRYERPPVI